MFVVIPVMVAEVAEDRSRGGLGVLLVLQGNAGSLLGFLIAHFLHYELGLWLCLLFPALFLSLYSFMPETPNYLMKTNRIEVCLVIANYSINTIPMKFIQNNCFFLYSHTKIGC